MSTDQNELIAELAFWKKTALDLKEKLANETAAAAALRLRFAKELAEDRLTASLRALED